ncbi:MAG: polysaccharide deacetylase family protein [Paludibacter sp.]|nr:polysaccharide deacetylase family protein [Paludibacter sp.]
MKNKFIFSSIVFAAIYLASCNNAKHETMQSSTSITDNVETKAVANTAAQILAKKQVPIICYHRIENGRNDEYTVSPTSFTNQIKTLSDSGYHSISPDELYDYLVFNKTLPEKPFMITFDDSRVEHSTVAAPILEKYNFRGVFFIMTITYNKKNYMTTDQIAALAKAGHTVGLHSWDHTMVTKYDSIADWQKQVIDPKKKLESITGKPVEYFAYPYGLCNRKSATEMSKYMKLAFILSTKRDSIQPLHTVRRMIVPEWTAQGMIRAMKKSF